MKNESLKKMISKIPEPVYPCAVEGCAEEHSFPPNMLRYWKPKVDSMPADFYCEFCYEELVWWDDDPKDDRGPTLEEVIKEREKCMPSSLLQIPATPQT